MKKTYFTKGREEIKAKRLECQKKISECDESANSYKQYRKEFLLKGDKRHELCSQMINLWSAEKKRYEESLQRIDQLAVEFAQDSEQLGLDDKIYHEFSDNDNQQEDGFWEDNQKFIENTRKWLEERKTS